MLLLKEIVFSYQPDNSSTPLFNKLNLKVEKGSYFVLLGPLASGKSTLVRLLAGLVGFQEGEYWFNGEKFTDEHRRSIGVVFENVDDHFIGLTIEEDLSFSPRSLGFSEKETEMITKEALSRVGLNKTSNTPVESLSAGEKQRLAIAGALTKKPLILISDESTAYLDPHLKIKINQLFIELKKTGLTIFHTTHLLEEALLSDKVGVLEKGKIRTFRPAEILLNLDYLCSAGIHIPNWLFKAKELLPSITTSTLNRQFFLEYLCSIN